MKTLKQQIKEALNLDESMFSNWSSDLYILYTPEVEKYLKDNYKFYSNVRLSYSNVKGQSWYVKRFFDIPFAYTESH
jgi:hypothetical protein